MQQLVATAQTVTVINCTFFTCSQILLTTSSFLPITSTMWLPWSAEIQRNLWLIKIKAEKFQLVSIKQNHVNKYDKITISVRFCPQSPYLTFCHYAVGLATLGPRPTVNVTKCINYQQNLEKKPKILTVSKKPNTVATPENTSQQHKLSCTNIHTIIFSLWEFRNCLITGITLTLIITEAFQRSNYRYELTHNTSLIAS